MKNILITGLPGSGKSTLLKKMIEDHPHKIGFITNEVRNDGERVGFEIETYNNKRSLLASVHFQSGPQVSKYRVNVKNLDSLLPEVEHFEKEDLLYIDEVGQMELYSNNFKSVVLNFLDSDNICLMTFSMVYDDPFIKNIKSREDVIIFEITEENREEMMSNITESIENFLYKLK